MTARIGLGPSDFRQLRQEGTYYVDKSRWLVELLGDPNQVLLFPRPRRFGKTLNQSMLRYFLEKSAEDRRPLFEDLAVWRSEEARRHFGRYPVVSLTFKALQASSFDGVYGDCKEIIAGAYEQHRYLLDEDALTPEYAERFQAILDGSANSARVQRSLLELSRHLRTYHGEQVVILIDEYDAPIHSAHVNGYYDQMVAFIRGLLSAALKDNPHLFKAVLTGVLRIAKESLFSGLNNVMVQSILSHYYSDSFGFTQVEVQALADAMGQPALAEQLAHWYDGYRFGDTTIYNPWSVLSFAQRPQDGFRPYWVLTSAEDVLRPQVFERRAAVAGGVEVLLRGEALTCEVSEHLVLRDLDRNANAVWSLLLHSGYLTARSVRLQAGRQLAELVLPNSEMRFVFERSIRSWMEYGLDSDPTAVHELLAAMLEGDEETFGEHLTTLVSRTFSYHDTGGDQPERVYQAFLLGLLVYLQESHEVRSNRESGLGRYDVMVLPRQAGEPGVVLECKRLGRGRDRSVDEGLTAALRQIGERDYAEELKARGATPIHAYGVVFDGKRVWVRREGGQA